jgi:hypothetical protein
VGRGGGTGRETYLIASQRLNISAPFKSYVLYAVLAFLFFCGASFFLFFCGFWLLDTVPAFSFFDRILGTKLPREAHAAVVLRSLAGPNLVPGGGEDKHSLLN